MLRMVFMGFVVQAHAFRIEQLPSTLRLSHHLTLSSMMTLSPTITNNDKEPVCIDDSFHGLYQVKRGWTSKIGAVSKCTDLSRNHV
jgi:hypothetical protein